MTLGLALFLGAVTWSLLAAVVLAYLQP